MKMSSYENYTRFFGYSPNDPEMSALLDSLNISERPEYEDSPDACLSNEGIPVALTFGGSSDYREYYGIPKGCGTMVLECIRFYSSKNTENRPAYRGTMPCGIDIEGTPDKLTEKLGSPDFNDKTYAKRVLSWANVNGLGIDVVLTEDDKHIEFIDMEPMRID
jgi:hypothetical protein